MKIRFIKGVRFNKGSLLGLRSETFAVDFGVYRCCLGSVEKLEPCYLQEASPNQGWIWGRAVERYDKMIDYLGFGPVMLFSWIPR